MDCGLIAIKPLVVQAGDHTLGDCVASASFTYTLVTDYRRLAEKCSHITMSIKLAIN